MACFVELRSLGSGVSLGRRALGSVLTLLASALLGSAVAWAEEPAGRAGQAAQVQAGQAAQAAQAQPKRPVEVHIIVIEADKKSDAFDKRLEPFRKSMPGYTGAKIVDELNAKADVGSSVSLEIQKKSGKPRLLKVTVQKIEPDEKISLRVAIDALKFSADTTHKNGAPLLVGRPLSTDKDKALFLAVTPSIR